MSNRIYESQSGLNIGETQHSGVPTVLKHETVIINGQTIAAFGSNFTIDIREKACILHDLTLALQTSAITGLTGTVANYPNFVPAVQFIDRIDILQNGNTWTRYGDEQFLINNLFKPDEQRLLYNTSIGNYSSNTQRAVLASTSNYFYIPLDTFFNASHMPLLHPHSDIQLRIFIRPLASLVNQSTLTGTAIATFLSSSVLARVTRLKGLEVKLMQEIQARPHDYRFLDLKYQVYTAYAGTTAQTFTLNAITGKVAFLIFTIRTSAPTGSALYTYLPVTSFSILDSTGTNIVGGQDVYSQMALTVLNKEWVESSFTTETAYGITNNNAYVYMFSFSADTLHTLKTASRNGEYIFNGNEQLKISCPSLAATSIVECYAYTHSVVKLSHHKISKHEE